ncbi:uncharacterized protein TNCV_1359661 [Trichonephila clavipes]|nr:uncharacterized protein TNCV_1359661 [Trichonephila clavipes]
MFFYCRRCGSSERGCQLKCCLRHLTKVRNSDEAAIAEWSRYRIMAGLVMSSSPVPLNTRHVVKRCTLSLSRAQTSSRWCGVLVRKEGCQLRCCPRHLTLVQNYVVLQQKPPRVAEQCDVNTHSLEMEISITPF